MNSRVKQELAETTNAVEAPRAGNVSEWPSSVIDLGSSSSSSSSSSDSDSGDDNDVVSALDRRGLMKKRKLNEPGPIVPVEFLQPISQKVQPRHEVVHTRRDMSANLISQNCKQFWKAGDYEGAPYGDRSSSLGGIDHVRVHPRFLHSNATSHKWALGAFAELMDNALDEVRNGATFVNIDMLVNKKDGSRMLLIEVLNRKERVPLCGLQYLVPRIKDAILGSTGSPFRVRKLLSCILSHDNGGGMDPDKMRHCMSLGYSAKSKLSNTIGQYGNGFKTSTMRLGADVIVFTRSCGKDSESVSQSVGLLSYTFLRSTGKEDIIVPMLDYKREGYELNKLIRTSQDDWKKNSESIVQWSPFSNEADLLLQFSTMKDHGTRIIIFNLWEDDQGQLELDFNADPHDIQIRGVNRDEKNIQMAKEFPNSRHFLTYRHSLRSYASILYLRLPLGFRLILRGKDVAHHNIINDMMMSQEVTYRPQAGVDGISKDTNMVAVVTIGFVKDARHHIDVQGFNVYHKNRLIKPFWRVWNAAGSDGRGVIGVLEANFVEPAHDKQGFERTTVLARLESKLLQMQKSYWTINCHRIGYAPRRNKKFLTGSDRETSSDYLSQASPSKNNGTKSSKKSPLSVSNKINSHSYQDHRRNISGRVVPSRGKDTIKTPTKFRRSNSPEPSSTKSSDDMHISIPEKQANGSRHKAALSGRTQSQQNFTLNQTPVQPCSQASNFEGPASSESDFIIIVKLRKENRELKERLEKKEADTLGDLVQELQLEREKCKSLEIQLGAAKEKVDELNKEQESLIDIFSEERERRDNEERKLRKKLQEASNIIQELQDKVGRLEKIKYSNGK